MGQMSKISKNNTTVSRRTIDGEEAIVVTLYSTDVVTYFPNTREVVLNDGGWRTVTTKARMNQAARQLNLGYYVQQRKGEWLIHTPDGSIIPFNNTYERFTI